jgi:hypothetical protein
MIGPESAREATPSTAQIAAAGTVEDEQTAGLGERSAAEVQTEQASSAEQTPAEQTPAGQAPAGQGLGGQAAVGGSPGVGDQSHAQLLEDDELQRIHARWKDIQAAFVDEPRKAVQDADTLVADLMQRLATMFASERDQLESRWSSGDDVSTEDLRRGLRRYRSFFERLLAA